MPTVTNTHVYTEEWVAKLQERLSEPQKFKDICNVVYTDMRVLNNPYLTEATVQGIGRGTPYSMQQIVETNESVTVNDGRILPQFIDRADLAQSTFLSQMELADKQAILLNEAIETAVYADHPNFTNFGSGDITGGTVADTTTITVSLTNIASIILNVLRVIEVASGQSLLARNGAFIVWRPADFLLLRQYAISNGFALADQALKTAGQDSFGGWDYLGVTHYASNLLAANHVFAGVKKLYHLGILKATYGQIMVDEKDPNLTSGVSIVSRVDFKGKVWIKVLPLLLDVNVA